MLYFLILTKIKMYQELLVKIQILKLHENPSGGYGQTDRMKLVVAFRIRTHLKIFGLNLTWETVGVHCKDKYS